MNIIKVKEVDLHVARKCNNQCEYCYVSPNDPKVKSAIKSNAPIYGETDTLKQVISKIHSVAGAEDLVFVGGDPCQHPNLVALIKHAKIEGLNTVVLSNTHSYRDNGAAYDIAGLTQFVDELDFTLHGATPEMYDAFTKCPGSYELATANLKRFAMARRDGQAIGIILNMVPDIIHNLPIQPEHCQHRWRRHLLHRRPATLQGDGNRVVSLRREENPTRHLAVVHQHWHAKR